MGRNKKKGNKKQQKDQGRDENSNGVPSATEQKVICTDTDTGTESKVVTEEPVIKSGAEVGGESESINMDSKGDGVSTTDLDGPVNQANEDENRGENDTNDNNNNNNDEDVDDDDDAASGDAGSEPSDEDELQRLREERNDYEERYNNLLSRLSSMKDLFQYNEGVTRGTKSC